MLKKLAFLAILVVVLAAAYGAAATIGLNGGAIQYGIDANLTCDDYVGVAGWGLETGDDTIQSVRIGDVSAACAGNELFVQVLDVDDDVLAHGNATIGSTGVVSVGLSSFPASADITQLKIWIEGGAAQ